MVAVSGGGHHSVFLTESGLVFACGNGNNGQLGLKTTTNRSEPTLVLGLSNK